MINRLTRHTAEDTVDLPVSSHRKFAGKWMRAVGSAEGISFLLLLFVAMPLKYLGQGRPGQRLACICGQIAANAQTKKGLRARYRLLAGRLNLRVDHLTQ